MSVKKSTKANAAGDKKIMVAINSIYPIRYDFVYTKWYYTKWDNKVQAQPMYI